MNQNWYAIYTKPRWEKKVADNLTLHNVSNYCPLNKVLKQWSDRRKTVLEPLFTSYVFVHVEEKQLSEVKKVNGVLHILHWLGKPAIIRDNEIELIRQFLSEHQHVKLEKDQLHFNDKVKINSGSLREREGTVVAVKNNRVKIALPSLGYIMYAEVESASIVKATD
ncbi:UpxY family transcription antiterminator [Pontibacter liquoris]|uniref:UpxY family transcription antiterminator n=1 Tax=Pontibacter liquoris TaxID=2905677 RepID=UPI001FA80A70|nr:UpxY family transcription antiterminator [Pontibacter liquoris]